MYKYYNECLFDSVIIIRESDKAASDFESVRLFGVNYEEKSKEIYRGVIDCFKISPSCQFDFNEDGNITVFCKDFSQPNGLGKIFAKEGFTGEIIALKDCK